ncbi:LysR substrate-binding domain-containing protein [Mesorhizobium sp. LHD-90]|uniref:LysR family transcriptional regulator n=1 Tax=Mesorhizobium sp. LHD-90 TaxID=3071414 RepID=UPI0027E12907|nr:LysR substrate-binding domain-containing protein [Mesorhizobium sp. LHD-90]MDQ6434525.1 LysR substrate-binding domain-containing protein [Mesorhizobium sp. LHD-90]
MRQLRYFTQVVESGSFSKAATHLHVAQPALSQHVRHMEEELGVSLLHRGSHGVSPTEAGDRLLRHAKRIIMEFAEIPDSVRGEAVAPRGEVRFGLPGTVSELLAAPLIEAARERYPEVRIRVVEAMSGYILDWLKRGDVDLAMIYGTSDPRGLAFHHGLSEEICLFVSTQFEGDGTIAGETIKLSDAARLPLLVPGPGHGLRELIETAALSIRVPIAPAVEIDSYSQIKKLAQRGLGYGILPRMAVQREAYAGIFRVWRIEEPPITRRVYLAYSTERPLLNAPRAIGQLSWDILRQLVRDNVWTASLSDEAHRPDLFS